jgi:2-amino-4-hydroxy-6-hydroxymethyldihydropteridine diphosphokinase
VTAVDAVVALGSNLGDRAAHLQHAVDGLVAAGAVAVSAIFETAPVGGPAQPDYYNAVVLLQTQLSPTELLALAHRLEADAQRTRTQHWGPRTLDVDVISYGELRSDDPALTLPHPRAHERAFVLAPWLDLDAKAQLTGRGAVSDLLATLDPSGVRRLARPVLSLPSERSGG